MQTMSSEKQIEEMAKLTCNSQRSCYEGDCIGSEICAVRENCEKLYNAGYRKQSEGEWKKIDGFPKHRFCSRCGKGNRTQPNFCPHCGAKMKGGAE